MTTEAERIRQDIERTRAELSQDVDSLTDKVSPARIVERRVDKAKGALSGVKEKVMGAAPSMPSMPSMPSTSPGQAAGDAKDSVTSAAAGNPLAAGLIAFGAGWLVSSLLPASSAEKQAAGAAKTMVQEHSEMLTAPLQEAAATVKENLQEPVQEAVEAVRSTATDAVASVKDEAGSAMPSGNDDDGPKHAAPSAGSAF
jgi:hypothetical protein